MTATELNIIRNRYITLHQYSTPADEGERREERNIRQ
jgi:hypothetical protein